MLPENAEFPRRLISMRGGLMLSTRQPDHLQVRAMTTDFVLAVIHHVLVFSIVAVLALQIALMRPGLGSEQVLRLSGYDMAYGTLAALVLIVGFVRVYFGAKGAAYYLGNHYFWGKISAFVIVGLISIGPTLRIRDWVRQTRKDPAFVPPQNDVMSMRRLMHAEGVFLFLVIVFAAAMARFAT